MKLDPYWEKLVKYFRKILSLNVNTRIICLQLKAGIITIHP